MAYAGEGSSRLKFSKKKLKGEFFIKNGARLLEDSIASFKGGAQPIRMFSEKELKKATNNYHQILQTDGFYTIYKGVHENHRTIMVKKYEGDERAKDLAFTEAVVLSHVNHRNVVKLIGCCIETEVPIIVCEYLSNGNLYHHIHEVVDPSSWMSWEIRLKIATEIAYALAYLHIANSRPIVVRDLKSPTIFLDESYTAKITDFGLSVLIPLGETFVETNVAGTIRRIDPQYASTGKLSDKSDVYSFGILLIELLTGKNPHEWNPVLLQLFTTPLSPKLPSEITRMMNACMREKGKEDQLRACTELALRCTRLEGEERPTMKQVTEELRRIKKF